MNGAEARVLEETGGLDLAGLLERHDRPSSESASRSCNQGCLANEAPEGQLADELRALLVARIWQRAARLLHAFGRYYTLPGGLRLRRELLSWGLA